MTDPTPEGLTRRLLDAVALVCRERGSAESPCTDPHARFADLFDSMGLVEFLLIVAREFSTTPEVIEECVGRNFSTVAELAAAMNRAGLTRSASAASAFPSPGEQAMTGPPNRCACWLGATTVRLPEIVQPASDINRWLQRSPGWLERHAGINERRSWQDQDAVAAAADAGKESLRRCGIQVEEIGALVVTSEAPPLLTGLGAAVHGHLGLRTSTPALEVGGACTGFVTALWLARALLTSMNAVLIISVEAPTRYLAVRPGEAGEAAALFGDGAAACVVSRQRRGQDFVSVADMVLGTEGGAGHLIGIRYTPGQDIALHLHRTPLAMHAVRTMAQAVRDLALSKGLAMRDLAAVVVHGGNGRMPAMLARQLDLPPERVWSETARMGNLGSASLPVAWAVHGAITDAPVVWTAVGAGLTWGAALTGPQP